VQGAGPLLSGGAAEFDGSNDYLIQAALNTDWDAMSYNATASNLKWTMMMVVRFEDENAASMGVWGNNEYFGGNIGVGLRAVSASTSADLGLLISMGGGASIDATFTNIITFGSYAVYTIEIDNSQSAADKAKAWRNTTAFTTTTTGVYTVATPPAKQFALGQTSSVHTQRQEMDVKFVMFLTGGIESPTVRDQLKAGLQAYFGL
jgi:hypothetical protein